MTEECDFFKVEPMVYNKLLPRLCKKTKHDFGPKSFFCPLKNGLVMENLQKEFIVQDRVKQLDFVHCKTVIETLAKFHAGSLACHRDDANFIEEVGKERVFIKGGSFETRMKSWVQSSFRECARTLEEIGGHQTIADLLMSKADGIWASLVNICKPNPDSLNVLNHGDCWTNNILFKYNPDGGIADLKLIDFQVVRYGSPVLDLSYFIWSSANEKVQDEKLCELYITYVKTLNETLGELGCQEKITSKQLIEDIKDKIDWVLITVCFLVPFVMCESEDAIDLGSLTLEELTTIENSPRFKRLYNSKNFKHVLPGIARQLHTWLFT